MNTPEIRRKLNDSYIGQRVNGTYLGILVEGLSRGISDSINILEGHLQGAIATAAYVLVDGSKQSDALLLFASNLFHATAGFESTLPIDAESHYSVSSKLYRREANAIRGEEFQRVPLIDVFFLKFLRDKDLI